MVYYQPTSVSERGLALMRRIDALHLQYPFAGARMLPPPQYIGPHAQVGGNLTHRHPRRVEHGYRFSLVLR